MSLSCFAIPVTAPLNLKTMTLFLGLFLIGNFIPAGIACDDYVSVVRNCTQCGQNALCTSAGDFFWCICEEGYEGDGLRCTLQSLCTDSSCCPPNYLWDNITQCCSQPNYCSNPSLNRCDPMENCTKIFGHYVCTGPVRNNSVLAHCNGHTCSPGEDCRYLLNSTIGCVDPCREHEELEGKWRANNFITGAVIHEDNHLHGWYHFIGESGSKMPESCQSSFLCGTGRPITLRSPHPLPKHGIVLMDGSSGRNCSGTAQIYVKACPGNFFVYKFMGLYYPGFGYCTDHTSLPVPTCLAPCAHDEESRFVGHKWRCHCKEDTLTPTDIAKLAPEVTCGNATLTVTLSKCLLERMGFNSQQVDLGRANCTGQRAIMNNLSVIKVTSKTNQCGSHVMRKNETHFTISNTLYLTFTSDSPVSNREIPVSCDQPISMQLGVEFSTNPVQSSGTLLVPGVGGVHVKMSLFKNGAFIDPYEENKLIVPSDTPIHTGVYVQDGMWSEDVVVMKNCFSTTSVNPGETTKQFYIRDRCPSSEDPSAVVAENGKSYQAGFAGILFAQGSDDDSSFVHCAVQLCRPAQGEHCVPVCPPSYPICDFTNLLTIGPIWRTDDTGIVPYVTCDLDGIMLSVSRSAVEALGYDTIVLPSYQNPQCIGSLEGEDQNTITIRTPFFGGQCGVQFTGSQEAVNVQSTVHLTHLVSGKVVNPDKRIPFSCRIPLHKLRMSHLYMESEGNEITTEMFAYLDANFTIPYPQREAPTLHPGNKLSVKVKLTDTTEPNVMLELRTCYATPSSEEDNAVLFIQDGTTAPGPIRTQIIENRNSSQGRFTFTVFRLTNGQDRIYLHCTISICMKSDEIFHPVINLPKVLRKG